jgi:hypothetical protein
VKAGRICPGYRNTVDLMFHDESKQIARRNKSRVLHSPEVQAIGGNKPSEQMLVKIAANTPVKLTSLVMYQPMEDLGVSFFMSTYVGTDPTVSQLHYLPKFYAKTGMTNPGLQQSIIAAGLAGYAKTTKRKDITDAATKRYVMAIQSINTALSDESTAMQEPTLLAIIMAAMFEVLIVPRLKDLQNCSKHLDGAVAVALLMLKQKQKAPTEVTRKLISTLVQSVIINSWISHVPLPQNFVQLKRQMGDTVEITSVHSRFLDVVMKLVQFRQGLQMGIFKQPGAIIRQALAIDDHLIKFAKSMPLNGRFEALWATGPDVEQLAYRGYYHGKYNKVDVRWNAQLINPNSIQSAFLCASLEQHPIVPPTPAPSCSSAMPHSLVIGCRTRLQTAESSTSRFQRQDREFCTRDIGNDSSTSWLCRTARVPSPALRACPSHAPCQRSPRNEGAGSASDSQTARHRKY